MCIAIYKPAGTWATKRELRQCYKRNPHGAGYAWHDGTTVCMKKGFFSWRSFWKSFKRDVKTETPAFMHFRIATSGKKDTEHCHPFMMKYGVLMHNGPCLNSRYCKGDDERSDTRQFVEDFVEDLTSAQFRRLKPMIEDFAGTEKVVAMFSDGEVVICNESQGHWHNGIWWSNSSYVDYSKRPIPGSTTGNRSTWQSWYDEDYYDDPIEKPIGSYPASLYPRPTWGLDELWSPKLQKRIKKQLTIMDDTYEWVEAESAYILADMKNDMTLFPLKDDLAIYGEDPDKPGEYIQVGYVIETVEDYWDLYFISDEAERTAATA